MISANSALGTLSQAQEPTALTAQLAANGAPHPSAIVIGGSMAGMLAAAALSRSFRSVTVLEKDALSDAAPVARRGVPQGRHLHFLLKGGEEAIERLLPGTRAQLVQGGAKTFDFGAEIAWHMYGGWKRCASVGYAVHQQSRPFLEAVVRRQLMCLSNVTIIPGARISGLLASDDRTRVVGVSCQSSGQAPQCLRADLIVDASGRFSDAPRWLIEMGYAAPEESVVSVDLGYASLELRISPQTVQRWIGGWGMALLLSPPAGITGGGVFPLEGDDRWMMTLFGYFGAHPPTDEAGFKSFAQQLAEPHLYEILRESAPLGRVVGFRYPGALRRHYERLNRFPRGLLVVGDARCSVSPIYGQGMSKAALEAEALASFLAHAAAADETWLDGELWRGYFAESARIVDIPWEMSTGEDLQYPQTTGERPWYLPFNNWYSRRLMKLAARDPGVLAKFFRVTNFVDDRKVLFSPRMVARAMFG